MVVKIPDNLHSLPSEILTYILTFLPLASLCSFSQTNSTNYSHASKALKAIELAVLPRPIHATLAFLNSETFSSSRLKSNINRHQVTIATSADHDKARNKDNYNWRNNTLDPKQHRTRQIRIQNKLASQILSTPILSNLQSLTLHIYEFDPSPNNILPQVLSTKFPLLRYLDLNFDHQYLHDPSLPADFWKHPSSSSTSIWDIFIGQDEDENGVPNQLRNLEEFKLSRANLTSTQLLSFMRSNPNLKSIWFENCTGVDFDFLNGLSKILSIRNKLKYIHLPRSFNLSLNTSKLSHDEVVERIEIIRSLLISDGFLNEQEKSNLLSLRHTKSIPSSSLERLIEHEYESAYEFGEKEINWRFQSLILPDGKTMSLSTKITDRDVNMEQWTGMMDLTNGLKSPALSMNDLECSPFDMEIEVDPACM